MKFKITLHLCGYSETLNLGYFKSGWSTGLTRNPFQETSACSTLPQIDLSPSAVQVPPALWISPLWVARSLLSASALLSREELACHRAEGTCALSEGFHISSSSFLCCFYRILNNCYSVISHRFILYL